MSSSFLSTFSPDRFSGLQTLLSGLFATSEVSQDHLKELYAQLDKARPWFLNLLNIPQPSKQEREQVENGTIKIGAKTVKLNAEFIAETLFLSSQLNVSELLAANLLRSGITLQSRHGNRPASDTAVIIFHGERADMLACLKLIFDPAVNGAGGSLELLDRFGAELKGSLVDLGQGKEGSLVERIMVDLEATNEIVHQLVGSLGQGPTSSSTAANNQFAPPPPAQGAGGGAKLSLEMTQQRITSLKQERKALGHVLFLMSYSRNLRKKEVQGVVRWLSRQSGEGAEGDDVLIGYMVATALAAFDLSDIKNPDVDHDRIIQERFIKDSQFIKIMTSEIVDKPWSHHPLQSVIILQWTLFLVTAFRYNRNLEHDTHLTEDIVENMVGSAIRGDAFQYLTTKVVGRDQPSPAAVVEDLSVSTMPQVVSGAGPGGLPGSNAKGGKGGRREDTVDSDFRWHILTQVDALVANFITTMSPILRKLKHREEDLVFASLSSSTSRPARSLGASTAASAAPPTPRADVEALFTLIATIYRDSPPEAALKFWNHEDKRLFAFLRWASDARTTGMIQALFEMLSSLSVGLQSSTFAFNFLSTSEQSSGPTNNGSSSDAVCSWSKLFGALSFYANQLPKVNEAAQSAVQPGMPPQPRRDHNTPSTIPPEELALLKAFLRLLKNVVHSSPVARAALYENQTFRAIPTLLSLVNSVVPIEFKAALFDTLAAFCGPDGGSLGADIAKQMWVALEKFEVIPTKPIGGASSGLYRSTAMSASRPSASGGIIAELEDAETSARTYPATTSFVHLLNSLIHTPAKSATLLNGFEIESHTIPDSLGAGARTPGIGPYVRYVLDDVLLKAPKLAFVDAGERWRLTERALCFVEKCLASYDLSPLLAEDSLGISSLGQGQKPASSSLAGLALHPGFEILRRFLTEPALLKALFDVVSVGFEGLSEDAGQTPSLAKSVLRAVRIVYRILQIESLFIEVLLPTLAESRSALGSSASFPTSVAPLDQHLLYAHPVVVQIALLINYVEDPELVLLSIKTITLLSQSPFFTAVDRFENVYSSHMNRLVGIIDSSDESLQILDGYVRRLEEDDEDGLDWPSEDPIESLVTSDAGAAPSTDLSQAIRFAILDLLLQNTVQGAPGPNLAHFLTGFDLNRPASEMSIEDPQAQGTRLSCLHIVFELLAQGAPRESEDGADQSEFAVPSLLARNPGLAEKCSRLVYQLSVHDLTASATTRYIRTREDYCFRQLLVFPMSPPAISYGALGHVVHSNGQQTATSAGGVTSFLRYRSSLLDLTALELHVINPTGLHAAKLVDTLFTSPSTMLDDFEAHVRHAETADQPLVRILDILLSLDFEWQDEIPDQDINLAFFSTLDFKTCLRTDDRGCEIYDFRALISAMNAVRRQLQRMGAFSTLGQQEAVQLETRSILLALAVENHRRQIGHAKHHCLVSWQRALDVVLFKSFELIPLDQRETVIFDIMQAVFHLIGATDTTPAAAELLCEVVLSLITKLRQGRREQNMFSSENEDESSAALPTDKLLVVLRRVLDCVTRAGTSEMVRGNLYTVLINYLQLLSSFSAVEPSPKTELAGAMEDDESMDGAASTSGGGGFRSGQRSPLEVGTLSILTAGMERLAPVLARDALDGSEIWKTVAYTTLECLVTASREDRSHRLLAVLAKNGFLQSFVQSLKDTEDDLLNVLAPDPDNLNSLYVFEAKAALLVRIAQSRYGAERILESRLFDVLSQCHYIDARPEMDQTYFDLDSFLPPVIERYHQILLPTLQLVVATLSSLGPASQAALHQAMSFIDAHRETILLILKDSSPVLPLPVVKEFHLLATLFHFVLPRVEPGELGLPSGFGAYHMALLGLGGRFFLREKWEEQVVPVNDTERAEAETPAPDVNGTMLFDYNVDRAVEDLNKSLLSYFVLATESSASRGLRPVLVPASSSREVGLQPKHGAPTISAAIALLYEMTVYLNAAIDRVREISGKLAQPSSLGSEEIEDIVLASGVDLSTRYSSSQRHQLALQSLSRSKKATRQQSLSALFIVESLLLLLWRHLLHYVNDSLQDGPDANWATVLPSNVSLRFSQGPGQADLLAASSRKRGGWREMWERVEQELGPALKKLERVELTNDIFGSDAGLRQSYVSILTRRLRELDLAFSGSSAE